MGGTVPAWQHNLIPDKLGATSKLGAGPCGAVVSAVGSAHTRLNIRNRRPTAATACPVAAPPVEGARRPGAIALAGAVLVALALALALPAHAAQGGSGGLLGSSAPEAKDASQGESLTYDSFTGFNCSQSGFFTSAVGHLTIRGAVTVEGRTFLDGKPYDTYTLDLGTGPATFPTDFSRTFASPPPSSTYQFVFDSRALAGKRQVGRSVTTIVCQNGVLSAANVWTTPEPVPAGHPAAGAALALLLAGAAWARLRARRA